MQHLWIKRTTIRRDAEQPWESRAKQKRTASYFFFNRNLGCGDHLKNKRERTALSSCFHAGNSDQQLPDEGSTNPPPLDVAESTTIL